MWKLLSFTVEPFTRSKYRQFVTLHGAYAARLLAIEARRNKDPGSAKPGYHARLFK